MASQRSDLDQAKVNAIKVARSAIRLKHSIAADTELNQLIPVLERQLEGQMQKGIMPTLTVDEVLRLAEEV